jgi:hypothetical protein
MFKVAIHMANVFKLREALLLTMKKHPGQCHTKLVMPETLLFKKKHAAIYILGHFWFLHSSEQTS